MAAFTLTDNLAEYTSSVYELIDHFHF
jgi:hypothetical protein